MNALKRNLFPRLKVEIKQNMPIINWYTAHYNDIIAIPLPDSLGKELDAYIHLGTMKEMELYEEVDAILEEFDGYDATHYFATNFRQLNGIMYLYLLPTEYDESRPDLDAEHHLIGECRFDTSDTSYTTVRSYYDDGEIREATYSDHEMYELYGEYKNWPPEGELAPDLSAIYAYGAFGNLIIPK